MSINREMFIEKISDGVIFYKQPFLPSQVEQILQAIENYPKLIELFIKWNERETKDDSLFAESVVKLIGSDYNKTTHEINLDEEESNEI